MVNTLNAWTFSGELIGCLSVGESDGLLSFSYDNAWMNNPSAYPISPAIPFKMEGSISAISSVVSRYFNNLLPEGKGLEDIARMANLSKSNLFGLLRLIGKESSGAMMLLPAEIPFPEVTNENKFRLLEPSELSNRIRSRETVPFIVWDKKIRLSLAGYQDKIGVVIKNNEMYLVDYPLASTHILKPMPIDPRARHLVANEHFCMMLSSLSGVRAAKSHIFRVPEPVLAIERFDRTFSADDMKVARSHVVDGCQSLDLPNMYKYERNYGSEDDVKHIRDGVSFKKLFDLHPLFESPVLFKADMLRWSLIQYLLGNADAHGKNISFHVTAGGLLKMAPAYDLVCTAIYPKYEDNIALSVGDEFQFADIGAYQWADFAQECGVPRRNLAVEMKKIAHAVAINAPKLIYHKDFIDEEQGMLNEIVDFVLAQSKKMEADSKLVGSVSLDVPDDLVHDHFVY